MQFHCNVWLSCLFKIPEAQILNGIIWFCKFSFEFRFADFLSRFNALLVDIYVMTSKLLSPGILHIKVWNLFTFRNFLIGMACMKKASSVRLIKFSLKRNFCKILNFKFYSFFQFQCVYICVCEWHYSSKNRANYTYSVCAFCFFIFYSNYYLILILWSFNLNPNISLKTPDNADSMTTLIVVYKYGFALRPDILKGDSNSCKIPNKSDIYRFVTIQKDKTPNSIISYLK